MSVGDERRDIQGVLNPGVARPTDQASRPLWVRRVYRHFSAMRNFRWRLASREEAHPIRALRNWQILALFAVGLHSGAMLSPGAAQTDVNQWAARVEQGITFSILDASRQNSVGMSEGFPAGVPRSYSWYRGWSPYGVGAPPSGFTAVTGWGQVYQDINRPIYVNPDAQVEVANARTYVRLRSTNEWMLVQDQRTNPIKGGHFVPDFAGNAGFTMNVTTRSDGAASFAAPPIGYNDHFWHAARGTFPDGEVDGVYVQMDMRVTDPDLNLIASLGADWWLDATAPYVDGHGNNPGVGSSNWVNLSTEWRTLAFISSGKLLRESPPPPLAGPDSEAPPLHHR